MLNFVISHNDTFNLEDIVIHSKWDFDGYFGEIHSY